MAARLPVRPDVFALDVDDLTAVHAFKLGVNANPADSRLHAMVAMGALYIDFELIHVSLCHRKSESNVAPQTFRPAQRPVRW